MASFTDAISTFNPYVSQLPIIEEMSKVGMERQGKYDQGIQKIQGQIDNVAGMDIIKDVDRANLQSKLNQLGSDLKKVAASDFSNFQLVNSVGGMASQIIKDPTIQNAVSSTANYRKQVKDMEAARKAGKSDKNNEEYFQNDANKWLTSSKVGETFSGSYMEHVDVMKLVRDSIKDAGLDATHIEQMYETDTRGNIKLDKDGHGIPSKIMTTEDLETNAPKVKAIVENLLSQGNIQQQIKIDGWANTRYIPVESVYRTFENDFNVRDAEGNQRLLQLQAYADSNSLTVEQKQAIINEQNNIKRTIQSNDQKLEGLRKQATESPEQFKQDYYEDNYKNNLLSLATTKIKKENKESPLRKQINWEEDMTFKKDNENFNRIMQRAADRRSEETLRIAKQKESRDAAQFDVEFPMGPGGIRTKLDTTAAGKKKGDVSTSTDSDIASANPGASIDAIVSYTAGTSGLQAKLENQGRDLIHMYLSKANQGVNKSGKPYSREDTKIAIQKWAAANGETEYGYVTRFAADIKNKAEKENIPLSAVDNALIGNMNKLNQDVIDRLAVTEDIYKQVKNETGIDPREFKKTLMPQEVAPNVFEGQFQYGNYAFAQASPENRNPEKLRENAARLKTYANLNALVAEKFKKVNVVTDNFSSSVGGTKEEREAAVSAILPLFNTERLSKDEQTAFIAALEDSKLPITYDAHRPIAEGQPWTGTAFISVNGVKHSVELNQRNLEIVANRKFNPYVEDGLRARVNSSDFGSTNLGTYVTDPNAYQTAAIGSGRFSSLIGTDYTAKADIQPLPGGELILQIYAKDKTMKDYQRIEFPLAKLTPTGTVPFKDYNEIAREIPNITPGMIKIKLDALKKSKQ
tara:strand:- start:24922 stop:27507 length:2586 start_codon:yes stop_codon:yes gene_type:complete